jgi:peptidoglycan/LPS O-acetylase OafA/YrhL
MKYRPEIDGLRALAILPVLFFHAGFKNFSGGFVGVDVFFVISGYLITSIIVSERQAGKFTLMNFYERRARRILPALFFVMLACLPFAWWLLQPGYMYDFSESLIAVAVFASNIFFWRKSGYFDTDANLKPLLHTWSLGVEEQYYLFFPIFLLLIWRFGRGRMIMILLGLAAASLSIAHWSSINKPDAAFYLLPMRVWELLVGSFVAFLSLKGGDEHRIANATIRDFICLIGFLLIAYAVYAFDETTPFPSLYALVPTLGAALIIVFSDFGTRAGRLLGNKLLVGIGLLSYSLYLWHQPLFAFARLENMREPNTSTFIILSGLALLLAYFSWRYIEKPFRTKNRINRGSVIVFALLGIAAFTTVGAAGVLSKGFESYYEHNRVQEPYKDIYSTIKKYAGREMSMSDNGDCNFWFDNITADFDHRFDACTRKYGKAIIVLGDSHAMNIYNALYKSNFDKFLVGLSQGGCRAHDKYSYCPYDDFSTFVRKNKKSIKYVLYHQSGSYLLKDYKGRVDSDETFEKGRSYSIDYDNIRRVLDYLETLTASAEIIWLGPFAEARVNFSDYKNFLNGYEMNDMALKAFSVLEKALASYVRQNARDIRYVSLENILSIDKNFLKIGDCLTYRNKDHFSACGESIVGARIKTAIDTHLIAPDFGYQSADSWPDQPAMQAMPVQ